MSEDLQRNDYEVYKFSAAKKQKFDKANKAEQQQGVSSVQSCANKKWIDLYYKYDSDRPVAGALYTITDLNGGKIVSGKLDARGYAHVAGLADSLSAVKVFYSGDPKPFEIFNDRKPIKNPYYDLPPKPKKEEPGMLAQGVIKFAQMYLAYEDLKMSAAQWTWEAIQGDWNDDQTFGQIVFDSAVSMIPVIDQAADVRDISANLYKLTVERKYDEFGPWFGFVMSLIGAIPEIGTAIKGAVKSVIKVGKNAATAVIKKGVKFGEHLILKSGIDIGALIRVMNYFGEGNVVAWLRQTVRQFSVYKRFVKKKMREILTKIRKNCLELKEKLFESAARKLDEVVNNIDEVMRRVEDYVEEIMTRGEKELDDATKTAEDYSIKANLLEENGAKQMATPDQLPKYEPVKSHPKAKRMEIAEIRKIAADAGMESEELMGLIDYCNKNNQRVVVRFTNPHSLKWHGQPHHVPKSIEVKLKTAKSGPNAGLVVKPHEPMLDWEIENIDYLKKNGYEFDHSGRLVDNKGNRIYGDYDLQSVQTIDPQTGKATDLLTNKGDSNIVNDINGSMGRRDRSMIEQRSPVQHGAEGNYYIRTQEVPVTDAAGNAVRDASGIPVLKREMVYKDPARGTDVIYDPKSGQMTEVPAALGKPVQATEEEIAAGNAMLGRQYGDDEKYLVVNPDQSTEVLENPHELYELARQDGRPWKYEATPATGEQLAAEQAQRAEKKRIYENMQATEAIAEKVQMEKFIDDIIGDGRQFDGVSIKSGKGDFWKNDPISLSSGGGVLKPADAAKDSVPWGY